MTRMTILATMCVLGVVGCDSDSPTTPSPMPQVIEGTVNVSAVDIVVVSITVNRSGTLSSSVDWNSAANDVDSGLLPGTCSADQIALDAPGCTEADALAFDDSLNKPSTFTAAVAPGVHSLVLFNLGFEAETVSYRLEIR